MADKNHHSYVSSPSQSDPPTIVHRSLQTPVVVLSDLTLPPVVQAGKKLGAQDFLNKTKASGEALDKAIQKSIATVCKSR